jgi:hypothetical protein
MDKDHEEYQRLRDAYIEKFHESLPLYLLPPENSLAFIQHAIDTGEPIRDESDPEKYII